MNNKVKKIIEILSETQFTGDEIRNIFWELKKQKNVLGGKLWTIADICDTVEDYNESLSSKLTPEIVDKIRKEIDPESYNDTTSWEDQEICKAIEDSELSVIVSDIEWDEEEFYTEDLPDTVEYPLSDLADTSIEEILANDYGYCVKSFSVDFADAEIDPEYDINGFSLMDDSCFQYGRKIFTDEEGFEHWAYVQLEGLDGCYRVRGCVNLCVNDFDEEEMTYTAKTYGYDTLQILKDEMGDSWQQIVIEQMFESDYYLSDYTEDVDSEVDGYRTIAGWLDNGTFCDEINAALKKIG